MPVITTAPTVVRVECDIRSCDKAVVPPTLTWREWQREFGEWFKQSGWSIWVGRGRRYYCPDHGPSKGSTMRRVS